MAHGNGTIELTGRGNLQVRGLAQDNVAPFAAAMVEAGLAHPDPAAESRRNVLVSPLAGDDPDVAAGTTPVAASIEAMLADGIGLERLSPKFCVLVDGGGALPLSSVARRCQRPPAPASASLSVETITASWCGSLRSTRAIGGCRLETTSRDQRGRTLRSASTLYTDGPARCVRDRACRSAQTDAARLAALVALAERFGDGIAAPEPLANRAARIGPAGSCAPGRSQGLRSRPDR